MWVPVLHRTATLRCALRCARDTRPWRDRPLDPRREPRLRRALQPLPLGAAADLQHRRRCLRPLGRGRARSGRAHPRPAERAERQHHLRLAARHLEPARQCAGRAWSRARRPRRDPAAAVARGRRHPCRGLQARRHRAAARDPVRGRCAGLPAAERGREGPRHQRAGHRQASRHSRRSAGARARSVDRRRGRQCARLCRRAGARVPRVHAGRDRARRSSLDDLHVGHDRPAEGCPARSSGADRASAGHRDAA
jgi:hypothetical protein